MRKKADGGGFRWGAGKSHAVPSGLHLVNKHVAKFIIKVFTFLFLRDIFPLLDGWMIDGWMDG